MSEYYYLIASLPMLSRDAKPVVTSEQFLESIDANLPSREAAELKALSLIPSLDDKSEINSIDDWNEWETSMRNAIVRMRAGGDSSIAERNERDGGGFFSEIETGVQEAFSKSNPLERENLLDKVRWDFCDEMELGHEFDIVKLAAYRLKLLLCEKRSTVSKEKGEVNYDEIIESVYDNGRNNA